MYFWNCVELKLVSYISLCLFLPTLLQHSPLMRHKSYLLNCIMQIAASCTSESSLSKQLEQWNELYGDGGSRKKQQLSYFFWRIIHVYIHRSGIFNLKGRYAKLQQIHWRIVYSIGSLKLQNLVRVKRQICKSNWSIVYIE